MYSRIESQVINRKDQKRWDELLFSAINGSYISSLEYEYAKALNGREISTFIFQMNGDDIAGVHYSVKKSKKNIIKTADILSGFIFRRNPERELVAQLITHFIQWATKNGASYARINTWLPKTRAGVQYQHARWLDILLSNYGFSPIQSGLHTYWIDLRLDEKQLLENMRPQTRSKIRKVMKSIINIERYDNPDNEAIEIFWNLYKKLGKQKNFNVLSESRFKLEVNSLLKAGLSCLLILRFKGIVVNAALASNFGKAMYFHGALNTGFQNYKECPSPGYLVQWELIRYFKSIGLKTYDMAFSPGPTPVNGHPLFDIWRFKYGFGGDHVEYLPVYGKVIQPIRGRVFQYIKCRK